MATSDSTIHDFIREIEKPGAGPKFAMPKGMDVIGSSITTIFLLLGLWVTTQEAGYSFDLRQKRSPRIMGGRRASDA